MNSLDFLMNLQINSLHCTKTKGRIDMFYNRFMEICREYGEKPTPVLKKLDISPGNLKRWEGGASITCGGTRSRKTLGFSWCSSALL